MPNLDILDSWKEISKFLRRDIRTCYRWEKELGLPVHRFDKNSSRSSVFAYKSEINEWLIRRGDLDKPPKKSFLKNRINLFSTILLSIIVFSGFAYLYFSQKNPDNPSVTVAIFPLRCPNSLRELQYLSKGITRELKNYLSMEDQFRVITADYPDDYENEPELLINQGKKLNADFLLKGKVENDGDREKLVFQLFKTNDGLCLWDDQFFDFKENTLEICKRVFLKIYEELSSVENSDLKASLEEQNPNSEAYDHYLKGNFVLNELKENSEDPWKIFYKGQYYSGLSTRESNELAIDLFSGAIEIDPKFAPAYIGLANCYANFLNFGWYYDIEWLHKAEDLLVKANELSPNNPEYFSTLSKIYLTLASAFNKDTLDKAYEVAEAGLSRYPNNPDINSKISYFYYLKFGETGDKNYLEKSMSSMENCFHMKPYSSGNIFYSVLLMLNKKFQDALEVCDQTRKVLKGFALDYHVALIRYFKGDLDMSRTICERQEPNMNSIITNLYILGKIAARENDFKKANEYADRILILTPDLKRFSISQFELSSIYFGINKKQLGYKHLAQFFGSPEIARTKYIYHKYIEMDKNFDEVRQEERFLDIIKGVTNGKE